MQLMPLTIALLIWLPFVSNCQELVVVDNKRYVISELGNTQKHIVNAENLLRTVKIMGPKIGMETCNYTHLVSKVEDYKRLVNGIEVEGVEQELLSTVYYIDDMGSILEVAFIVLKDSKIDITDLSKLEDYLLHDFGSFNFKDDVCKDLNYIRFIYSAKTQAKETN